MLEGVMDRRMGRYYVEWFDLCGWKMKWVMVIVGLVSLIGLVGCERVKGVDHSLWDMVLKRVVVEGEERNGIRFNAVDFEKIRSVKEIRKALKEYVKLLGSIDVDSLEEDEALAFMLNAYNAFTVDLIVEEDPERSILDLNDPWKGSVFDRFKYKMVIGGNVTEVSLNYIEHGLIRGRLTMYENPKIHSAVHCVSLSCANLRVEAYTGQKLRKQLREQTVQWIRNEGKGLRLDKENKVIWLSMSFSWFREDFVSTEHGGLNGMFDAEEPIDWALQFAKWKVKKYAQENQFRVQYMEYDWSLIKPN